MDSQETGYAVVDFRTDTAGTREMDKADNVDSQEMDRDTVVDFSKLSPGESFQEYCSRQSIEGDLPAFCDVDRLFAVESKQYELTKHSEALSSFCEGRTLDSAFQKICQDWLSTRQ